ncbi:MAG: hypothetical protein IKE36_00680 [Solobacterium sp.]|nr:hypothetical protein [Solobacterium sp.]
MTEDKNRSGSSLINYDKLAEERKAKEEKVSEDLQKLKEEAEAEAGKIIELFHKGYQKKQEELQRKQAEEIEAEAQAAAEQIREKYRRETREEWADDETRKAWRSFVNDLVKETEPAEDPGKK